MIASRGASTATPSFTAPTGPATLTFDLEVYDDGSPALCDTDTVEVDVGAPGSSGSATFPNACKDGVTANNSQISVTMSAEAPASVGAGDAFALGNIAQSIDLPGDVFVAGYNLGLLAAGANNVPATVSTRIEATNTAEGAQATNNASTSVPVTISDLDDARRRQVQGDAQGVATLCRVLEVSRSGYYASQRRPACRRDVEDERLGELFVLLAILRYQPWYRTERISAHLTDPRSLYRAE